LTGRKGIFLRVLAGTLVFYIVTHLREYLLINLLVLPRQQFLNKPIIRILLSNFLIRCLIERKHLLGSTDQIILRRKRYSNACFYWGQKQRCYLLLVVISTIVHLIYPFRLLEIHLVPMTTKRVYKTREPLGITQKEEISEE
jgi:hypothetical protein